MLSTPSGPIPKQFRLFVHHALLLIGGFPPFSYFICRFDHLNLFNICHDRILIRIIIRVIIIPLPNEDTLDRRDIVSAFLLPSPFRKPFCLFNSMFDIFFGREFLNEDADKC